MRKLLIICIVLMTGCSTIRNAFTPAPPLKESEIPYQLKPGAYESIHGEMFKVTPESPRWSVSPAFLYDTVSNTKPVEQDTVWKKYARYFATGAGVMVILVSTFLIGKLRRL
jgi:hypothetical protein